MTNSSDPYVHPIQQPILSVVVTQDDYQHQAQGCAYCVGRGGVTRIEACQKNGEYTHIPYIRVWADEKCLAEFCQHNIVGVFFDEAEVAHDQ